MKYILASQSPRRRELLARTGLEFEVIPSDVDEKITKEIPSDVVMELAHQKAENVYGKITDLNDYRKPMTCCLCLQTARIKSIQVFH